MDQATMTKTATGKDKRKTAAKSTQTYLRIGEIRDNILVLKNGGLRGILKTTSINFNLKSEQEQNSIIQAYQNFLNSLEFPVQILVRSKKLDVEEYISSVRNLGDTQANKLLQEQTYEYADYIQKLVEYAEIMEKEFYVIVPYDPLGSQNPSRIKSFLEHLKPQDTAGDIKKRHKEFEELSKSLNQRINTVESGLSACGLQIEQASTAEIISLFYQSMNPVSSRTSKMKDLGQSQIRQNSDLRF